MYYEMSNGKYNLAHVVKIQHLKGVLKFGYKHFKNDAPSRKYFFGLLTKKGHPAGYYRMDWLDDTLTPVTKEKAVYSDNMVEIWFVGDKHSGREWTLNSEEEVYKLIELCKQSSQVCKYGDL